MQLVKEGEEEDRGDDGNGLWNCQPFKQPLSVPVPVCPSGSSRAQPLQVSPCPCEVLLIRPGHPLHPCVCYSGLPCSEQVRRQYLLCGGCKLTSLVGTLLFTVP